MSLDLLHRQLADAARKRVHSGELTERGLARLCGVSQPHMHNVLKGIRALSTSSADRLLSALRLNVAELLWQGSDQMGAGIQAVPVLRNRIGPGTEASFTQFSGCVPFLTSLTTSLINPVAARISPDLVLPRCIAPNDLALLDQNPSVRELPPPDSCWVVSETYGLRIRYLKLEGTHLLIANESSIHDPRMWRSISLRDRAILDIVKARVVWIGREIG